MNSEVLKELSTSYLLINWNICCMLSVSIPCITCVCPYMLIFIVAKLVGINVLVVKKGSNTNRSTS